MILDIIKDYQVIINAIIESIKDYHANIGSLIRMTATKSPPIPQTHGQFSTALRLQRQR
jgi:hypothetical protein